MSTTLEAPAPTIAPEANPHALPLQALQAGMRRFSVAEYHRLMDMGIITSKSGVTLIEGFLVQALSKNPPHSSVLNRTRKMLDRLLPPGWDSRIQEPITLIDSEPEPDYVIVRGTDRDFQDHHPEPTEIGLIIEVADTLLLIDRSDSQRMYARAGIPVYWIVNIPDRQIEVYTNPQAQTNPPRYANRTDYPEAVAVPVVLDQTTIAMIPVAELLP